MKSLSKIKTVAFDLDQTLIDETYSIKRRWKKVLKNFSFLNEKLEETFFDIFDRKGADYKSHIDETLKKLNLSEEHIITVVNLFKNTRSDSELLYDKVVEVLLLLKKKGFKIGVITDGQRNYQEYRLKQSSLLYMFDFCYYGDEYQKPDPKFFRKCFDSEKIIPSEFLYVGDDIDKDIKGALSVGAMACLIGETNDSVITQNNILCFKTMNNFYIWLKQQ